MGKVAFTLSLPNRSGHAVVGLWHVWLFKAGMMTPNLLGKPAFAQTVPSEPTGRIGGGLSQGPKVFNPLDATHLYR
ncbi:hypothetical protein J4E08_02005 [Sagittula sp. NFXS13]|uniref:hypothetical protein n=1 Tax=Sagittula sp. NFXS13 TaxID=2819095 RepID=UPI0032DF91ED